MRNVLSEKIMKNVIFKFNAQEKNVSKHLKKKNPKNFKNCKFSYE